MNISYDKQRSEQQKTVDRIVLDRVLAGIALLEKTHGPDWAKKIDLDRLDLASGRACVLGQMYGSYEQGMHKLELDNAYESINAVHYGFDAGGDDYNKTLGEEYEELNEAWRIALA